MGGRIFVNGAAALLMFICVLATTHATEPVRMSGQYLWHPEIAPEGPVVAIVSLDEQRIYVYRNGVAIGYSTISSGRRGYETPVGIFTILQKDRDHHSNKYDDAPMPYMERLTWDGVAIHGGALPGYPASHGCVRLPHDFAERLFAITRRGDTVVVASGKTSSVAIVHPSVLAPVTPSGSPTDLRNPGDAAYRWDESMTPPGPVSIVVSVTDRRVHVLRNGIRIGTSRLDIAKGFVFKGAVVFVRLQATKAETALPAEARWAMYRVSGDAEASPTMDNLAAGLKVPDEFVALVEGALAPGTSILVVDRPVTGAFTTDQAPRPVFESESPRNGKLGASH
jgi:hypothetical protein